MQPFVQTGRSWLLALILRLTGASCATHLSEASGRGRARLFIWVLVLGLLFIWPTSGDAQTGNTGFTPIVTTISGFPFAIPAGGLGTFGDVSINDSGTVAFVATTFGSPDLSAFGLRLVTDDGIFQSNGGVITPLVTPANGFLIPPTIGPIFQAVAVNDSGTVVFMARNTNASQSLFQRSAAGALTSLVTTTSAFPCPFLLAAAEELGALQLMIVVPWCSWPWHLLMIPDPLAA